MATKTCSSPSSPAKAHDLYVNDGTGVFEERAAAAGIRLPSLPYTGFGAAWIDFDNDGWLDILTVNGAVRHSAEALTRQETFSLQSAEAAVPQSRQRAVR